MEPQEYDQRSVNGRGWQRPPILPPFAVPREETPLPGYICERCLDAPAVLWMPGPEGEEMGMCEECAAESTT